ncbi:hypothetical protein GcC1_205022 [Golovinomyces cichoracearum]|uniref:Uncharacterized protein n=1 Tax=Golovinomyces cichoracearum TaxID=62708 RepID=A0A420HCQ8_9PEZI|nr:hypothetical protein GcC1_205022 [Golovinomyces cichoracearum]
MADHGISSHKSQSKDPDPILIELIPSDLWSLPYLSFPGILAAATRANPIRVGEICAAAQTMPTVPPASSPPISSFPSLKISAPHITAYDGEASTLPAFCSQLDPTIPAEIKTLSEFLSALKQRCQDPGLCEKATRIVENLYQKGMKFHDFITIFEDNMTDSTIGCLDKIHWKIMLERRLSTRLKNSLVTAHGVPIEYDAFFTYLREIDAAYQEINHTSKMTSPQMPYTSNAPILLNSTTPSKLAEVQRWTWITNGHLAMNCPLGKTSALPISAVELTPLSEPESLKD